VIGGLASLVWISNESQNAEFSKRYRELFFKVLQKTKFRVQDLFEYDQTRAPGEVKPLDRNDKDWVTLIKENNRPFAIARQYEGGRILAVGHDGFLTHQDADGERLFLEIALTWLQGDRTNKKILFSAGNQEVLDQEANHADRDALFQKLASPGWDYQVDRDWNVADTAMLNEQVDILVIANAQQPLPAEAVESVKGFVANGGCLLVVGLGWAWEAQGPPGPNNSKPTLDNYPMNLLLKQFGAGWTGEKIQPAGYK